MQGIVGMCIGWTWWEERKSRQVHHVCILLLDEMHRMPTLTYICREVSSVATG